ncbi:hypothetical protein GEMRC1_002467 [Eukaryota sp. GEM-RC1]
MNDFSFQQTQLALQVQAQCDVDFEVNFIGAFDVSFSTSDTDFACAAFCIYSYPEMIPVYDDTISEAINVPYQSGFLGFREAPIMKTLFERYLSSDQSFPNLVCLVDGCGIHHPRRCGSASHIGVILGISTIGVSKSLLCIEGLEADSVKKRAESDLEAPGDYFLLHAENGDVLGSCLKSSLQAKQPIYVSIGHKIDLEKATEIVTTCSKYRISLAENT